MTTETNMPAVSVELPPAGDSISSPQAVTELDLRKQDQKEDAAAADDYYTVTKEDITSEAGKQQAASGNSSLSLYLQRMGEAQEEAIEKFYSGVRDGPCKPLSSVYITCEHTIEDSLDNFTNCRQPLDFLPWFQENDHNYPHDSSGVALGAYTVPLTCEYCGASTTSRCNATCQRPKLYFKKQKPPFASSEGWDPITEYELPKRLEVAVETNTAVVTENDVNNNKNDQGNWVTGLFTGSLRRNVVTPDSSEKR